LQAIGARTYKWTPANYVSNANISNPIATPLQTTTFVVTGYNALGCSDSAKMNVIVNSLPTVAITKDTGVCKDGSIGLLALSPTANTYSWLPQTTLNDSKINNPFATPTDTTTYTVTVTDNNNCSSKDSVTVQLWPLPIVKTRPDTSICIQSFVVLQTTDSLAASVLWQPSTGLSDASALSPTDTALSLTTSHYTVSAFTNHGCLASDSVNITGLSLPFIALNADSLSICVGKSASLKATASIPSSYIWYPATGLSNINSSTPIASPDSTITYHVNVTGTDECTATDSIYISVKQLPDFSINPTAATICNGDSILITASGGDNYLWQQPLPYPDSSSNFVHPIVSTIYTVKISDTLCGVIESLSSNITISYPPTITVQKSNDIDCIITTATISASGAANYSWYDTASTPISTNASVVVTPNVTTRYLLKAFSSEGCETDTSIIVNVNKADAGNGYVVPTAFTPTGHNPCFGVKEWGHVISIQFNIYNRWGQLIFATSNIDGCWDGTVQGTLQDAGTYVYDIEANTICGLIHRKGTFVLIR
jgi:gliding motility-associated-like protein